MTTHLLIAQYAQTHTLPAATPTVVDVPIDGARDWLFVLHNTGSNPVTALSLARAPLGVDELVETAVGVPTGIPLAAGDSLPIEGTAEPITTLRVTLTSTLGTTVRLAGGGR